VVNERSSALHQLLHDYYHRRPTPSSRLSPRHTRWFQTGLKDATTGFSRHAYVGERIHTHLRTTWYTLGTETTSCSCTHKEEEILVQKRARLQSTVFLADV